MCIQTAGVLARWTGVKTEQMLCEGLRRGKNPGTGKIPLQPQAGGNRNGRDIREP